MKHANDKFKAPTRTLQESVDRVIDWYEANNPEAGRSLEVNCFFTDLQKFEARKHAAPTFFDGKIEYRGRELVPIKVKTPSAKKYQAANQSQIDAATSPRTQS